MALSMCPTHFHSPKVGLGANAEALKATRAAIRRDKIERNLAMLNDEVFSAFSIASSNHEN